MRGTSAWPCARKKNTRKKACFFFRCLCLLHRRRTWHVPLSPLSSSRRDGMRTLGAHVRSAFFFAGDCNFCPTCLCMCASRGNGWPFRGPWSPTAICSACFRTSSNGTRSADSRRLVPLFEVSSSGSVEMCTPNLSTTVNNDVEVGVGVCINYCDKSKWFVQQSKTFSNPEAISSSGVLVCMYDHSFQIHVSLREGVIVRLGPYH